MNKALIFSAFLLICLLFPSGELLAGNVQLNFTVKGNKGEALTLSADRIFLGDGADKIEKQLTDGKIDLDFDLDIPMIMSVSCRKKVFDFYIEPNNNLTISFDASKATNKVKFSGKGSANNSLLFDFNDKFAENFDEKIQKKERSGKDVDAFEMKLFNWKKDQTSFVTNHKLYKESSLSFQRYATRQINFNYLGQLLNFSLDGSKGKKSINGLPKAIYDDIKKQKINIPEAMISENYRKFLDVYFEYFVWHKANYKWDKSQSAFFESMMLTSIGLLKGEVKRYYVADKLLDYCGSLERTTYSKWYKSLKKMDGRRHYSSIVHANCDGVKAAPVAAKQDPKSDKPEKAKKKKKKKKKKGNKGNTIPERSLEEVPYVAYDTLDRLRLMEDFKGKVVYLDFWASWCRPCTGQFKYTDALKAELKKQVGDDWKEKVVFVYISIDRNKDAWKKSIKRFGLQGEHLFSPGGWGATVNKQFGIRSIPRYMIINKEGEIVNKNAPRPQQKAAVASQIKDLVAL